MSSRRDLARGRSLNPIETGSGAIKDRRRDTSITKPFVVKSAPKTGITSVRTSGKEVNTSSNKMTPKVKTFSLSTRQNTLESDELDMIGNANHLQSEFRKISIRKKTQISNCVESIKKKLATPLTLPRMANHRKALVRADTEVLRAEPDSFNKGASSSFKVLKPCVFKRDGQLSKGSINTAESSFLKAKAQVSFKLNEPYYHTGLAKYWETKDEKYAHYFNHLKKSHFSLRELASDYLPPSNKREEFFAFKRRKELVLALDLDETLIHCCNFDLQGSQGYQHAINYRSEKGIFITAKINLRPHLHDFLEAVSSHFDIVIYTASEREYALAIVNFIDPQRKFIADVFHRESCVTTKKGFVVKDLRVILPNELNKIFLVDNSSHCFAPQLGNGIPITSFTYDESDRELMYLRDFLLDLRKSSDVLACLRRTFRMHLYSAHQRIEDLITWLTSQI